MPHATAKVGDTVIADTDTWETVEGNVYTDTSTYCPWKGDASYYTVTVADKVLPNAAWYYPQPMDAAKNIKDHVAFYKNKVDVSIE
ncbi:hypothetical protein Plec18170_004014 [Paecilomyces lecythidis]